MIIEPNVTPLGRLFWKNYIRRINKKGFRKIELPNQIDIDPNKSILLLANHVSWWDGFWAYYINDLHWKKKFHVMMLEENLRQRTFLRQVGAYSVQPGSPSVAESLKFSQQLLKDPNKLVLLFPQGVMASLYQDQIQARKGAERILSGVESSTQVIFAAATVDYFEFAKPTLYYFLEEWKGELSKLGTDFQNFYANSIQIQKAKTV